MEFETAVARALLIVRQRQIILSNTAPTYIKTKFETFRIKEFVQAVEKLNVEPFHIEKCFLADLEVVATRVWEAYTVDSDGDFFNVYYCDHWD